MEFLYKILHNGKTALEKDEIISCFGDKENVVAFHHELNIDDDHINNLLFE